MLVVLSKSKVCTSLMLNCALCYNHYLSQYVFYFLSDMEYKIPQPQMEPKVPSPTLSAASKGEQATAPQNKEMPMVKEPADQGRTASAPQKNLEKGRVGKVPDVSEATHDSMSVREPASQGSAPLADEEVQQRPVSSEAGKAFWALWLRLD